MPVAEPAAGAARRGANGNGEAVVYSGGLTIGSPEVVEAARIYIVEAARQSIELARGNTARLGAHHLKLIERQRRESESLQEEGFLAPGEFLAP